MLTELMRNPETKRRMLKIADEYGRLAELAEQRAKEKKTTRPGIGNSTRRRKRIAAAGDHENAAATPLLRPAYNDLTVSDCGLPVCRQNQARGPPFYVSMVGKSGDFPRPSGRHWNARAKRRQSALGGGDRWGLRANPVGVMPGAPHREVMAQARERNKKLRRLGAEARSRSLSRFGTTRNLCGQHWRRKWLGGL